jgi:hypothetical protein
MLFRPFRLRLRCGQNVAAQTLPTAHYSFAAPQNVID